MSGNFIIKLTAFFFLLLISQKSLSQTSWQTFRQLSGPEKRWIIFHPFQISDTKYCVSEARKASEEMKSDTMLDGDHDGGQIDAFRHACWMALLSQRMSWKKALSLGRAHEKGNYKQFKRHQYEEEGLIPDSAAGVMDLFNNKIGAQLGCENKLADTETLKILIKNAILKGRMVIIFKNAESRPLDCSVREINLKEYKGVWQIPKCIVASDRKRDE